MNDTCPECSFEISLESRFCPHCGRPQRFPNVLRAKVTSEHAALERRYQDALTQCAKQSTLATVQEFETLMKTTQAVMTCRLKDAETLVRSDRELFATFYQLTDVTRMPEGNEW